MTAIRTRFQTATAACAIAAAAVLTPAAVANADPAAPIPMAGVGSAVCDPNGPVDCTTVSPFATGPHSLIALSPSSTIFQNGLWWFGTPNPTPPTQTTVFTFYPLALVPGFLQPLFGWFSTINFEACIGGLTLHIGPYGTVSGSYSRGCA
jgi:hypothetical protein